MVAGLLPGSEANGHVAVLDPTVANELIQLAKEFRGLQLLRREAAQYPNRDRAVERRRTPLAAHIPERDTQLLRAVRKEIVKVAAHLARRKNSRGDIEVVIVVGDRAKQRVLEALRGGEFALH